MGAGEQFSHEGCEREPIHVPDSIQPEPSHSTPSCADGSPAAKGDSKKPLGRPYRLERELGKGRVPARKTAAVESPRRN